MSDRWVRGRAVPLGDADAVCGGGGVGFHPFVSGEDMLISVSVSPTGFTRNGRKVRAEARAKSTVKSRLQGVVPAEG